MVRGIDFFRTHFRDYTDYFTLIGGTACELTLSELGGFRATRDIDMLVLLENMNPDFAEHFHDFIRNGQYKCYFSKDGKRHFYRFLEPENRDYPPQIELLSRSMIPEHPELKYTPVSADDYIRSMSAIILSEDYYNYTLRHRVVKQSLPCLDTEALIVFKTAAYLNLYAQKADNPASVRSSDLLKHRNDIFRLLGTLEGTSKAGIPEMIRENQQEFIELFPVDHPEWNAIIQSQGALADTVENYRRKFIDFFGLLA